MSFGFHYFNILVFFLFLISNAIFIAIKKENFPSIKGVNN